MTQTEKFLTGARCSQGSSDLAVFESCSMWPKIRQSKIIPVGFISLPVFLREDLSKKLIWCREFLYRAIVLIRQTVCSAVKSAVTVLCW